MARRKRVRTDFTGYSPTEDDLLEWELELARMSGTREQEDSPEAVALPTPAVEEDSASTPYPSLSDIVLSSTSAMPGPLGTIATGIRGAELLGDTPTGEYAHEQFRAGWATRRAQALDARAEGMGLATSPETRIALDAITAPFKTLRTLEGAFLPEEYLSARDAAAAQEQRAIAEESGARAQELESQIGGQYSARATLARSTAGLMTQPEIILPTVGAIAGGAIGRSPAAGAVGAGIASIPMAQSAYNAAIDEAKQWEGITDEERHEYGMMVAAAELGPDVAFGVLGAGLSGVFSKYGPKRIAKGAIEEAVRRRVGLRVTGAVAGGAFTENVAEDAGLAVRDWLSESDRIASEDARSAIAQQVAAERAEGWRRRIDPTVAGGLMGGAIGGPTIGLSAAAQAARDEVVSERDMLRNAMDAGRRGDAERASIESLFSAVDRERNFDIRDAMYEEDAALARQRAEEDGWGTPDSLRVEDEMEAGFREMERQRQAEDLSALGPVTDARPTITPETIAAERQAELEAQQQQEQQAEQARLEQERQAQEAEAAAERARQEQQVAARREALRKQKATEERKQRRQQNTARQRVMDQVIAENPDASDAEVLSITEQRINDPAFELEQEVSQVRTREEASQRAQETKRRREAIKAARRANPEASDREIARQLNAGRQEGEAEVSVADVQATKQPQPQERTTPIPENAPVQQKINTLAEDMGINLGMSPTAVDASTPSYQGTYLDKARKFLRGIVDMDTTGSVAVQNLIRQGKVLVVPNPQFANMPASNNVAEFSPETGEMFIYTDRMDDTPNAAKEIVKAVHESGHFLQQGSREGRSATLSSIFGSDGHTLIRNAADSGDARARRAVDRAQELFPDNETVQNLEIPAYFFNEAMEDGGTLTGRLRNFIPNTVGRTRNLLRDRLGADLEISANDIAAAVDDVLNEAVATDIQPQGIGASLDNLGMVVGERYSRFAEAERNVPSYEGARDGLLRTEISDADVEVMPLEQMVALNDERKANEGQVTTTLNDILPHTALFSGYENVEGFNAMATMPVHFTSIPTASGFYSSPLTSRDMGGPREESITIDSALLHVASVIPQAPSLDPNYKGLTNEEVLRRILLHETQHAVQAREGFVPGANTESFIRRSTVRARDRAAQRLQEMAEGLDLTRAEESLPLTVSGLWQNEKRAAALVTPEAEAKLFLDQGYPLDSTDRLIRRYGDRYREAQIEHAEAQQAYQEERNRAFETYQRDYGETEARNTEARSRRTTEELAEAPAETTMAGAPGNIPVERTLDTAQYTGGVRQPPASVGNLGMAAVDDAAVDYSPTDSDAFRDWFGNSQMVDADGNPQVVYHGTTHEFNTFRPNDLGLIFVSPDRRFAEAFAGMDNEGNQRSAIPLYARAENVWDFDNPEHRQQLLDNEGIREQMEEFIAGEMLEYGEVFGTDVESWGTPESLLSKGDWSLIELPGVAQAIRDAGFDALTVREAGNKNTAVFDPNQLKHATDNKGTWSRQDDSILGMADPETKDRQPNSRRVLDVPARTWLRALFDPAIGTGRQALEIIENAAAAPSDTMLLAEKYAAEYDDALGREAAERNTTPSELNDEIVKKLDAISDREDSYDANLEAFHNVTKDYGKAGEALNKLRDKVDQLSLDMLAHRAEQARAGRALTPGEKARYTTIANNLGRYAHRMYAAGLGSQGKKWGKSVWNDWKKGENAHNYHLVENAVKHLVDNDLYIPDASEMAGVKTDQLRRLVQTWNLGNPEAMSKSDMQDALLNARDLINGDSGRMDAMAQSIVQELLGLTDQTSPITNYYRGGKLNDAILKERKNIPAPLRELLGEISHPAGRLMVTAGKQAEFVARSKMLMELRQASESDPVMQRHIQPPNAIGTPAAEGMSVLQGDSYGPLEGYLVSPNMKSLLGDTVQQLATFEQATGMAAQRPGVLTDNTIRNFFGKYGAVARTEKAIKIIGNPANFLWNFAGAPDMLLKNGNLDPRIAAKAMVTASEIIRTTRNPKQATTQARRVQRAGVTDSAFIGEINKAQWRKLEGIMKEMEGKSPLQVWNKLRAGGAAAVETYAMMDVWSKIANFYHQADRVLPAFYKAEGIERTQEQLDREAAEIVNRTNISYKRAAPLIKAIEQSGLTQFGTYFYETFRVEVTNAMQGIEELNRARHATTTEGRLVMGMQGTKRLAGQLTSWGLKGYLGHLLSKSLFGDDEEERRDTRSLFPDYLQNQDFVPMGFTDMPVGNRTMRVPVFMNASRIDPTGPSSDIMRSMLHEDASPSKIWEDIVDLYIAPRIVGQSLDAMKATFGDERITRTPLMEQVGVPGYSYVSNTFGANETRAWANVVETFLPGITTAYRDTNEIPDAEDPTSAIAFALTRAGTTMYISDPSRAASRVGYEYGNTVTTLRREVADYFDTNPNGVDEEHLLGRLTSMQEREREAFEEVARVYRGALNVGLRPREISTILKENRVPDEVINQLRRDRFESRFISKASIDRYAQNEMNKGNKTREEKREIRRKWDEAWRMLSRQQRNLRRNDG